MMVREGGGGRGALTIVAIRHARSQLLSEVRDDKGRGQVHGEGLVVVGGVLAHLHDSLHTHGQKEPGHVVNLGSV